ncbi:hypothetical protein CRV02_00990 [Arcobacter sp. CECT 8989]|uniref:hypothetical protein n=1 Tax=Arcobacter sp. CECT 8989 TaxID=2044509 RepID=UPI00100B77ED|nr:hypothetical protein [Arcobacter sp. CECT 8989]RXK03801.1 hypothetical protein CRV02_00990 [Arcobacter sp. CECT 8989]
MKIINLITNEEVEVSTPKELKEILKYANPMMMRKYKEQMQVLEIAGFGESIEIIRKQVQPNE